LREDGYICEVEVDEVEFGFGVGLDDRLVAGGWRRLRLEELDGLGWRVGVPSGSVDGHVVFLHFHVDAAEIVEVEYLVLCGASFFSEDADALGEVVSALEEL
jgi:hypothetical protein